MFERKENYHVRRAKTNLKFEIKDNTIIIYDGPDTFTYEYGSIKMNLIVFESLTVLLFWFTSPYGNYRIYYHNKSLINLDEELKLLLSERIIDMQLGLNDILHINIGEGLKFKFLDLKTLTFCKDSK